MCVCVSVCVCVHALACVCGWIVCVCLGECDFACISVHVPPSLCLPYNVSMRMCVCVCVCVCDPLPSHHLSSGYYDTAMPCARPGEI